MLNSIVYCIVLHQYSQCSFVLGLHFIFTQFAKIQVQAACNPWAAGWTAQDLMRKVLYPRWIWTAISVRTNCPSQRLKLVWKHNYLVRYCKDKYSAAAHRLGSTPQHYFAQAFQAPWTATYWKILLLAPGI